MSLELLRVRSLTSNAFEMQPPSRSPCCRGKARELPLSKVVNPREKIVVEASPVEEENLVAEVDLSAILRERQQEPVLRSRRPALYR